MGLFGKKTENVNWVECERKHGFDLNKNPRGCPLCELDRKNRPSETYRKATADLLHKPTKVSLTEKGIIRLNEKTRAIGSHPWFNTLFSGKAVGRIISNLNDEDATVHQVIATCKSVFVSADLTQYRGFPKDVEDESALRRLALHFLQAYSDLGLLVFKTGDHVIDALPSRGWDKIKVILTDAGAEFVMLPNMIFDEQKPVQRLTDEEREWFTEYLRRAEKEGFGEYAVLKDFASFLKTNPRKSSAIHEWFMTYPAFKKFISLRKAKESDKHMQHLATTIAGSKLALLRELGIVADKRSDYTIIGDLQ